MERLEGALPGALMSPWGLFPDVATWRNHSHVSTGCGDHNIHNNTRSLHGHCTVTCTV